MSSRFVRGLWPLVGLLAGIAQAQSSFDTELANIQQQWAVASYQITTKSEQVQAFEALAAEARKFSTENPQRAEPLIWEGIVLSTYAGIIRGMTALNLVKQSRDVLEAALKIDDTALKGTAYTNLAVLYSQVPGFPVGFGNDDKARQFFAKALAIDPDGIDSNYFYAQYLCDHDKCRDALPYLKRAAEAPPRPGHELADEGRHREITELMAKAQLM